MIGGPGKEVELDESKFGKRKYNRGRSVEGHWVFGGMERGGGDSFHVPRVIYVQSLYVEQCLIGKIWISFN